MALGSCSPYEGDPCPYKRHERDGHTPEDTRRRLLSGTQREWKETVAFYFRKVYKTCCRGEISVGVFQDSGWVCASGIPWSLPFQVILSVGVGFSPLLPSKHQTLCDYLPSPHSNASWAGFQHEEGRLVNVLSQNIGKNPGPAFCPAAG